MKKLILIIIFLFVSSIIFGSNLESFLKDYEKGVAYTVINLYDKNDVLYVVDEYSETKSDYIYELSYLLTVLEFYYMDNDEEIIPIVYESKNSIFNLTLYEDFILLYLNSHPKTRHELIIEKIDENYFEIQQMNQRKFEEELEEEQQEQKIKLFNK